MAKSLVTRNFQYKIVKNILLSILIPAAIILFSAWFFFGGMTAKPETTTAPNNTDSCKGMKKDTCKPDTCTWDSKQNMCLANN
jgi:hypothetical protein